MIYFIFLDFYTALFVHVWLPSWILESTGKQVQDTSYFVSYFFIFLMSSSGHDNLDNCCLFMKILLCFLFFFMFFFVVFRRSFYFNLSLKPFLQNYYFLCALFLTTSFPNTHVLTHTHSLTHTLSNTLTVVCRHYPNGPSLLYVREHSNYRQYAIFWLTKKNIRIEFFGI